MIVQINGQPCTPQRSNNVAELVAELGLPGPLLLIEHNGTALRREEWPSATLHEGDRLEVLRIAAGG